MPHTHDDSMDDTGGDAEDRAMMGRYYGDSPYGAESHDGPNDAGSPDSGVEYLGSSFERRRRRRSDPQKNEGDEGEEYGEAEFETNGDVDRKPQFMSPPSPHPAVTRPFKGEWNAPGSINKVCFYWTWGHERRT